MTKQVNREAGYIHVNPASAPRKALLVSHNLLPRRLIMPLPWAHASSSPPGQPSPVNQYRTLGYTRIGTQLRSAATT